MMDRRDKDSHRELRRYTVITLCVAAAVPVALIGGGIYLQYSRATQHKVTAELVSTVTLHKESIEDFLREITAAMRVVASTQNLGDLSQDEGLQRAFDALQRNHDDAFEDLGVIDAGGSHLAYVGPYDLLGKNYRDAAWFKQTLERKVFISDVFLGFREVPHFIIAVTHGSGGDAWILRATVNAARFGSFVENVRLGRTGGAYIVSHEGVYQTRSRMGGNIMEKVEPGSLDLAFFEGVKLWEVRENDGRRVLRAKTWMKDGDWLLIVQQDVDDAFAELIYTRNLAIFFSVFGALLVGAVAFLTTKVLVRRIERLDAEKTLLDQQLIQSSKLASIGEFSAGVAHEINNPLAVIDGEAGWVHDILKRPKFREMAELDEFKDSLREITTQVSRCREITHKLLSFARKMESAIKEVSANELLDEVIDMREREAALSNVTFIREYQPELPAIHSDPSMLRQVFLNLINNAIDAIHKGGEIRVGTKAVEQRGSILVTINDTGVGISPENLGRVFDPFFTTKAPGKGTGLGLSICHGIIEKLGGTISVASRVGKGTTFTIELPLELTRKESPGDEPQNTDRG
jgi:two-component system NtrC family sensor kinase